jgi:Protein of unknown function (DUF2785)
MRDINELASDKAYLHSIANNHYQLPEDIDRFAFLRALLQNFATTDAELRDELTYMILAHAIIDQETAGRLPAEQRETLLLTCIDDEHLFYHIGDAGSDSVFMRSFSLLIIAALLYTDAQLQQISEEATRKAQTALLRYAREERDWRGYIKGKGWAHSVAHLSDALDEIAQNRYLSQADRESVMQTLTYLATLPEPLCYEEDDRISFAAYRLIAADMVEDAFLETWVESLFITRTEEVPGLTEQDVTRWIRAANAKNFLRSLYFRLLWNEKAPRLLERISGVLKRLDPSPTPGEANP